jgi:hypothetical protein
MPLTSSPTTPGVCRARPWSGISASTRRGLTVLLGSAVSWQDSHLNSAARPRCAASSKAASRRACQRASAVGGDDHSRALDDGVGARCAWTPYRGNASPLALMAGRRGARTPSGERFAAERYGRG